MKGFGLRGRVTHPQCLAFDPSLSNELVNLPRSLPLGVMLPVRVVLPVCLALPVRLVLPVCLELPVY